MTVHATGGARAKRRAAGERQHLALVAPAPVILFQRTVPTLSDHVIAAAGMAVEAARRALAHIGAHGKTQCLTFVAPAPIVLTDHRRVVLNERVVPASDMIVLSAGRTSALTGVPAEKKGCDTYCTSASGPEST